MANNEQLALIKQGVAAWNQWRREMFGVSVDLTAADLRGRDLIGAKLSGARLGNSVLNCANLNKANLRDAELRGADLSSANLSGACLAGAQLTDANLANSVLTFADLSSANLIGADLTGSHLVGTKLVRANLSRANLSGANLSGEDLRGLNLSGANLGGANLTGATLARADLRGANLSHRHRRENRSYHRCTCLVRTDLRGANLGHADFSGADLGDTIFVDVDLSTTVGLEACRHLSSSAIDYRTLIRSGTLPLPFLRGCGLPDRLIDYLPSLIHAGPIQFYSVFISYSTADQDFASRLHADLQNENVRCWFAPHDMHAGKKIHQQIDEAIRMFDRLLLILSKESMSSDWVGTEIAKARTKAKQQQRNVLFPIRLVSFEDVRTWELFDADIGSDSAKEIREFFIPDFSNWKDHDLYTKSFYALLESLKNDP